MQGSKAGTSATASADLYRAGAAGALALGAGLAGFSEARADVILIDVNTSVTNGILPFDLDGDGVDELAIGDLTDAISFAEGNLKIGTYFANGAFGAKTPIFLTRFYYGDTIGKTDFAFGNTNGFFYRSSEAGKSPWEDGERGFFGFAVPSDIDQEGSYFGYVEAQFSPGNTVNIFRIGFENEVDTPITIRDPNAVPAPGGIGLLALGAAGILAYRRRQRKQSAAA